MKVLKIAFFSLTFFTYFLSNYAFAVCNNEKWFNPPSSDIKVFIGYKQNDQISFDGTTDGSANASRPVSLPSDMLSKPWAGNLLQGESGSVSYYEPDGKGAWRVCRIENWWGAAGDEVTRKTLGENTKSYILKNPELNKIPVGAMIFDAQMMFYDKQGRVIRVSVGNFEKVDKSPVDKVCFRYDGKDRTTYVIYPLVTKKCPVDLPDPRDGWKRYKYGENGGVTVKLLALSHGGKADGTWSEEVDFLTEPARGGIHGYAKIDSVHGVTTIYGSNVGKLDDNSANTVVSEHGQWSGSTYVFVKPPVPAAILDNPELIYGYDRRRETVIGAAKMYEFFRANQNISRDRYYMIDSFVVRHEQLDSSGKVTRVITLKNWRQPHPGANPSVDDKKLSVTYYPLLHEIFHRVYDIDAKGNSKLVAISWNKKKRLNPSENVPLDMAQLVYGTPDGKERWKTEAEFEKTFNTSAHANPVFPDNVRGDD